MASMRPPEFTGGNDRGPVSRSPFLTASMRPPEFTGGNVGVDSWQASGRGRSTSFNEAAGIHRRKRAKVAGSSRRKWILNASMRPPEFTGGNRGPISPATTTAADRFNEAAGIHRRKRQLRWVGLGAREVRSEAGFNEAAGIHRRKREIAYRPPSSPAARNASMRPPEFTGGNAAGSLQRLKPRTFRACFNEAAGIHRRKQRSVGDRCPQAQRSWLLQ